VSRKLWGIEESPDRSGTPSRHRRSHSDDAARSLLSDGGPGHDDTDSTTLPTPSAVPPSGPIGILQMLKRRELRRAVYVVVLAMLVQQGSGINAVIYYSTDILRQVVPTSAAYISLLISVVNVVMTFAPVLLIEGLGQRKLLLLSIGGGLVSTTLLGYGLDAGIIWLSGISILVFVASFALGMGPIPFMLTAELVPYYAVSPLASLALSVNWIANFLVSIAFIPLRDFLAHIGGGEEDQGQGRVFFSSLHSRWQHVASALLDYTSHDT